MAALIRHLYEVYLDHPESRALSSKRLGSVSSSWLGVVELKKKKTQKRKTHIHSMGAGQSHLSSRRITSHLHWPLYNFREFFSPPLARISKKMHISEPNPTNWKKKEPSAESNTTVSISCVLIESQEPHYDSSPIIGKIIFFGVVPTEFVFLNSFMFIKMSSTCEK